MTKPKTAYPPIRNDARHENERQESDPGARVETDKKARTADDQRRLAAKEKSLTRTGEDNHRDGAPR